MLWGGSQKDCRIVAVPDEGHTISQFVSHIGAAIGPGQTDHCTVLPNTSPHGLPVIPEGAAAVIPFRATTTGDFAVLFSGTSAEHASQVGLWKV